ncbi:hypothetical protein AQUCO_04100191v1 [Aquilegia coerulea]|uniref:Uncharacterized protein n=1 Tax=Aquilegia coerulea TaxID=218851 RepID=A0A2G5CQL9_AQUCA|nr:hypothetical protein AQUCO_04100191v1 [Aquilegia coerulea]
MSTCTAKVSVLPFEGTGRSRKYYVIYNVFPRTICSNSRSINLAKRLECLEFLHNAISTYKMHTFFDLISLINDNIRNAIPSLHSLWNIA